MDTRISRATSELVLEMGRAIRLFLVDCDPLESVLPELRGEIERELLKRESDLKRILGESLDGMDI